MDARLNAGDDKYMGIIRGRSEGEFRLLEEEIAALGRMKRDLLTLQRR